MILNSYGYFYTYKNVYMMIIELYLSKFVYTVKGANDNIVLKLIITLHFSCELLYFHINEHFIIIIIVLR